MASRGQTVTVNYVAWDTSANSGKTLDAANHTLRIIKDGASSAPTNSPSEVDSTNAPGVYKLVLTGTECTADCVTVCGKSSTANVSIIPITVTFEQLPTAAAAANGGLPTVDANNNIHGVQPGTGTGQLNPSGGKVPATLASTDVTGNVACDLQTIKTQTVTCAAGVTINPQVGAAHELLVDVSGNVTFNNTSIASVTTTTNLTNAPTAGDFTTAMKTSLNAATPASVTGSVGSVTGAVGSVAGNVGGSVVGDVEGKVLGGGVSVLTGTGVRAVDASGNALATAANQATIINDVTALGSPMQAGAAAVLATSQPNYAPAKAGDAMTLTSAYDAAKTAAQAGNAMTLANGSVTTAAIADGAITDAKFTVPTEPTTLATGVLSQLNQLWRRFVGNKVTQTATEITMYKSDGTTAVVTQAVSDDGTTQTQGAGS